MPNIMTAAEAEYNWAFQAYQPIRAAFYAGRVSPEAWKASRHAMEAALEAWEAEQVSA